MIFNCPACDAGHTVPASMIPNGGLDMECRRCGDPFLAHADGRVEAPARRSLGAAPVVIGTAAEHDDRSVATAAGASPTFDEGAEATMEEIEDPGRALEPELTEDDATQRLPSDIGSRLPSLARAPSEKTPLVEIAPSGPVPMADSDPGSVYDLVASGEYAPPPPAPAEVEGTSEKAWNEPSHPDLRVGGPLAGFARRLEAAPMAFKVALLTFPVALGVTLLVTAGDGEAEAPIEIPSRPPTPRRGGPPPAQVAPSQVARAEDEPGEVALADASEPVPEPVPALESEGSPALAPEGLPEDRPAPQGYLFVQRTLRLRARADETAPGTARLRRGRLVRMYEQRGPWALVLREPDGPAGFLPRAALDTMRPIAALADDVAFEGCRATRPGKKPRRACIAGAEAQLEACQSGCGDGRSALEDGPEGRCRAACAAALQRCKKSCRRR